jgi:hypothetical protein
MSACKKDSVLIDLDQNFGYRFVRFNSPELTGKVWQLAFQMLVAGVGFYQPKSYQETGVEPNITREIVPAHYWVFSHYGDEIGRIQVNVVNGLIHRLRANYQTCHWSGKICYQKINPKKYVHLADITFGWEKGMNDYVPILIQKFQREPVKEMLMGN